MSDPHLILLASDTSQAAILSSYFKTRASIEVVTGQEPRTMKLSRIQAMWLTPMVATYFGLDRALKPGESVVLPVWKEKQEKGYPALLITGGTLAPGTKLSTLQESKLIVKALLQAVQHYNRTHPQALTRIGATPYSLGIDTVPDISVLKLIAAKFVSEPVQKLDKLQRFQVA